jgi:uncharacterized protein YyaL (SSP411 family)
MVNRLADAVSPYLRSHADNPVDWWPWGPEPFAEARRRDVPVLVSIGYSTCHWCHVMARESFSDPELAEYLNERFVAIKVDREEHPDVDTSHLAAASAFTQNLGWPLNVFVTGEGKAFFAGTYWPPVPMTGHPSFRQILEAVDDAWIDRRDEVEGNAAAVVEAVARTTVPDASALPTDFSDIVEGLARYEDTEFGGFGGAPKFPVAPVHLFLLESGDEGAALASRTLQRMADSGLRDPIEGGFFRYATMRDWSQPHYERMLYDNAQLLDAYTRVWQRNPTDWAAAAADGIADFLEDILQLPAGGFASAQDSESVVDGELTEGDYYSLTAAGRARQTPPKRDEKVLAGWNGLAISALARAGFVFARDDWLGSAVRAADYLLGHHLLPDGALVRASIDGRTSTAVATLEDYGMLAQGLLDLALVTGRLDYANAGRALVDACLQPRRPHSEQSVDLPFAVPGGGDPVLLAHGTALAADPSEGAYPSGLTASARAAHTLYLLTAQRHYLDAAVGTMSIVASQAEARPIAFGAALTLMAELANDPVQLVVVAPADTEPGSALLAAARTRPATVTAVVTESQASAFASAGFDLFGARTAVDDLPTVYLCREFVCRLPVTDAARL